MLSNDFARFTACLSIVISCLMTGCGKSDMDDDLKNLDVEALTLKQAERSLYDDVAGGDVKRVAQIPDKYGDLIEAESDNTNSWMDQAAYFGQFEMMEFLRSKGFTYTHSPKGRPLGLLKAAQYGKQLMGNATGLGSTCWKTGYCGLHAFQRGCDR